MIRIVNQRARPELLPVGRSGTVDEVADVVVMLVTNGFGHRQRSSTADSAFAPYRPFNDCQFAVCNRRMPGSGPQPLPW